MYLLKWVLVVPDHDLGSDETEELDERVHVTQPRVSQRAGLGADFVSDVEMERVLEKRRLTSRVICDCGDNNYHKACQ